MKITYEKDKNNRSINFWIHITHGQFNIRKTLLRNRWTVNTYVFEDQIKLNHDFLGEYPFEWYYPGRFYEFEVFNQIIKVKFGADVNNMKYDDLMIALKWYKDQAVSGHNLRDYIFIKFYGDLNDDRHCGWGRRPLDYDKQLTNGNIIKDVYYGVGLSAGNIDDWESCYSEKYGDKFLVLKTLNDYKYMFSGDIKYDDALKRRCVDMSQGRQVVGMAFEVIDKGTMNEDGRLKLLNYMSQNSPCKILHRIHGLQT